MREIPIVRIGAAVFRAREINPVLPRVSAPPSPQPGAHEFITALLEGPCRGCRNPPSRRKPHTLVTIEATYGDKSRRWNVAMCDACCEILLESCTP